MGYSERGNDGKPLVLVIALTILVIVASVVLGGMFYLARSGAAETLRRPPTPTIDGSAATATLQGAVSLATAGPTLPLVITATPRATAPIPRPTNRPTVVAEITPTAWPTSVALETPTPTPNPIAGQYVVEYVGCQKHGSNTGTVKGQVFDRQGQIVVGAEVRVTLNDWLYETPGISNQDGWYEFYLDRNLKVKIISLRINGQDMLLTGNDQQFKSQGGCFEYVNLRQN